MSLQLLLSACHIVAEGSLKLKLCDIFHQILALQRISSIKFGDIKINKQAISLVCLRSNGSNKSSFIRYPIYISPETAFTQSVFIKICDGL